jgi:hypothetical protein
MKKIIYTAFILLLGCESSDGCIPQFGEYSWTGFSTESSNCNEGTIDWINGQMWLIKYFQQESECEVIKEKSLYNGNVKYSFNLEYTSNSTDVSLISTVKGGGCYHVGTSYLSR